MFDLFDSIRQFLPRSILRDIDYTKQTVNVYNSLREADNATADMLAANLADAENAFFATALSAPIAYNAARQALVAARMAGEAWLSQQKPVAASQG
jgi:hypothetical protein